MALAAGYDASGLNSGAEAGRKKSHDPQNLREVEGEGSGRGCSGMRAGHSLHETAIEDGRLMDPRPFGSPLKIVLAAMLGAGEPYISEEHTTGGFLPGVLSMAHVSGWNAFLCVCVCLLKESGPLSCCRGSYDLVFIMIIHRTIAVLTERSPTNSSLSYTTVKYTSLCSRQWWWQPESDM